MNLRVLILILVFTSASVFGEGLKAKYIMVKADKRFEVYKFFKKHTYNELTEKLELSEPINKQSIQAKIDYFKAVYDENKKLVRIEEYKKGTIYGFYLFVYAEGGVESKSQYHYLGYYKEKDQEHFHINISFNAETAGYTIGYYNQGVLVKKEHYRWGGSLEKTEYVKE